ncbi:hypothetical protein B0T25DRAFT_565506 [Lasiosphaeria hispida]|uniref:Uncharacterized protein n=1 Tax=Lasiosphaeria hispida TaxID=260671 RepID=A0AAJ0HSH0_9PEZI|nr:hypothetical protein B0T25DRAFT_565506 [Lasiosphaeria hispida]
MRKWGLVNNRWNGPLIAVMPDFPISADRVKRVFASFKNGSTLNQAYGDVLFGTGPSSLIWSGAFLIKVDGCFHFALKCPLTRAIRNVAASNTNSDMFSSSGDNRMDTAPGNGNDDGLATPSSYSKAV